MENFNFEVMDNMARKVFFKKQQDVELQ